MYLGVNDIIGESENGFEGSARACMEITLRENKKAKRRSLVLIGLPLIGSA
jgi:hypothetical protein